MRTLRRHRAPIGVLLTLLLAFWQVASPFSASAATYYWDINGPTPGAGGPVVTGDWGAASNWSTDPTGSSGTAGWAGTGADTAVFSAGTDATGSSVVTIDAGAVTAGALAVQEGNVTINGVAAGDKLTLSNSGALDGNIDVNFGSRLTLNAQLSGNAGLTKTSNGALVLTNNANDYTGDTVINSGSLVITNNSQLGASTSTVAVTGVAGTGSFRGGQLVVQGGIGGTTISRDLSVGGRGPNFANNSGALVSIGNNTFTGDILLANGVSETRVMSVYGKTTLNGLVTIGAGQPSIFQGNGNWIINGRVTGFDTAGDRMLKTGNLLTTTLWLTNNTNNFMNPIRIDSGTVRVSENGALGASTSNIAVDLNNGTLEVRTDAVTSFSNRRVRVRDNATGVIFVDHAMGSTLYNQTVTFSELLTNNPGTTFNLTGRNGYGASFTGAGGIIGIGGGGNAVINNNSNGLLTLNGNLWNQNDGTARTLSIGGSSEVVVTGSILAPNAALHSFIKTGSGTLSFTQGQATAASTFKGNTSINDGILEIRTVKILNDSVAAKIILGGGGLSYLGNTGTGAGETFTNKTFDLNAATGFILANQSGTAPTALILPNNFAASSTVAKTLILGGSSTLNNTIQGVISNNTNVTNVTKIGPGTWQLDAPAAANYGVAASGLATTNTSGSNSFAVTSTAGLVVGQPISGTGVPAGAVITQIVNGTTFTISVNSTAAVTSVNITPVGGNTTAGAYTASANTGNVITVGSTAGLAVGQAVTGTGILASGNWYISQINSATTFTIASGTGAAALTNSTVSGALTLGSSANFAGTLTITGGTMRLNATSAGIDIMNNTSGVTFNSDATITNLGSAGGTFEYAGAVGGSSETVGRLTPTAGLGIVKITGGSPSTLTFLDLGARGANSILNFEPGTGTISFVTAPTLTNGIINGSTIFNGTDWATVVGNNVAAYTGYTVTTGTIATGSTQNIKIDNTSAGNITMAAAGNTDIFTLLANDAAARTIDIGAGNTLRVGGALGGILVTAGSGGLTIGVAGNAGTLTAQSATSEIMLYNDAGVTINSVIANTGTALSVTKGGSGTLTLNGNNTFTGGVVVNQGGVALGHAAGLGVNGTLTLRLGTSLDLAGFSPTIGGLAGSGNVTNSGANATFSIGGGNAASVFAGLISDGTGVISMNKLGSGTIALTGLNTYTGSTTITAGTLAITSIANGGLASSLGASTNAAGNLIFAGGTLLYTGAGTTIYQTTKTPTVVTDRLFSLAGNGTIQSSGTYGNESLATGVQNNAALVFSNTGAIGFTTAGAKTLTLGGNSTGDNYMGLQLTNNTIDASALSVTKADAGLWILGNATNNYTGVTTISGGALQAVDGGNLPTASNLLLNGGVFQTFGVFDRALGTGADQVRWNTNAGGGFSASIAQLTVNIGGTGATLDWGANGIGEGTGTLILSSATALSDVVFLNGINLNGANRTIQVDDNGTTGLDYATMLGVISNGTGTAGFTKSGSGLLILDGANTYNGNTTLNGGTLVVQSIGNATGTTASSMGASGGNVIFNASSNLFYVGGGEVASRGFTIASTAASTHRIDSSGSGALQLNGVFTNTATAGVTLDFRGFNNDLNMVNWTLANNGANLLSVTKSDGGVWVLNPTAGPNTFTGALTAAGGSLGLTSNGIGSAASLNLQNGSIFAYGGDLTITRPVILVNSSTAVFAGQNNITINADVTKQSGTGDQTFNNSMENGAVLTINGNLINAQTAAGTRIINIRGFGSTVWNGILQNNSATSLTAFHIAMANNASLTLSGAANTYTGNTTLAQGILVLNKVGALGPSGTFAFNGGELRAGTDLSGATNKLVNPISLGGDPAIVSGSNNIEFGSATALTMNASRLLINNLTGGSTLTISSGITNSAAATLTIAGSGNTLISGNVGTGTGAQSLTYSGTGKLTLTAANTMTGTLTVNRGVVELSGVGATGGSVNASGGTTAIAINAGGTLRLDNTAGDATAGRIANRTVTIAGGALEMIGDANGTTESAGALTVNSATATITLSGAGPNVLRFASVNFASNGSSLDLGGIAGLGTTNKVIFTTEPTEVPASTGILNRVFIGGTDFATHDATNGVVAFTAYNNSNDFINAAVTDTMNLTVDGGLFGSRTLNALKLNNADLNGQGMILTLTAAGLLSTGGDNALNVTQLAFGTNAAFIQVQNGTTLNVNSTITGTGGLSKALGGTMVLNRRTYMNSTTNVLNGTLRLNAGLNTLFPGSQMLNLGANATLDLNGNVQYIGQLNSPGVLPNTGGTITSGTGTGTLVTNMTVGNTTYGGQLSGANVNFVRLGTNTLTLESGLTYGGQTILMGGVLALQDDAALLNTTSIDLNQATLTLNNNSGLQTNNNNRINDAASITMRGGALTLNARVGTATTENVGAVLIAEGANTITANLSGTTQAFASADLNMASFTRMAGTTVNFVGSNLGTSGSDGGFSGNNARINATTGLTSFGTGVLGAWAIANSNDYAGYNNANGVGAVGTGGYAAYDLTFASGNITNVGGNSAAALTTTLSGTTTTGMLRLAGAFTNDIAFTNNTDVLNLQYGGLLRSNNNNAASIGTTAIRGVLTAGGTETSGTRELVIYSAATGTTNFTGGATTTGQNVITMTSTAGLSAGMTITNANLPAGTYIVEVIDGTSVRVSQNATANSSGQTFVGGVSNVIVNSVIADNGLGNSVQLIKSGAGILNLSANNTYTGGTIINQGTVNLIGTGTVLGAGGVTITGASLVMNTNAGQIHSSNRVTLNGSSTLTLVGNNTLAGLTFNNNGGSGNPTVNVGSGVLTLTDATAISVTTNNAQSLPTISGGTLNIGSGTKTFDIGAPTVAGQAYTTFHPSMTISSVINGTATLNKTGSGLLQLSGQNTFSGGLNVLQGGIIIGANSTPNTLASEDQNVQTGPLGTGAVTMAAGTRLLVNDATRLVTNTITFQGSTATFDSTGVTTATLALNGAVILPGGAVTMDVIAPSLTVSLGGPISSTGAITSLIKEGQGTLALTGNFGPLTAPVTVNNGILELGTAVGPATTPLKGTITLNGGQLSLRNNGGFGTGATPVIGYNNDVIIASGITDAQISVGPQGTSSGGIMQLNKLTTQTNNQGLAVVAASGYNLRFLEKDISTQARFNITSGSTLTFLTSTNGLSQSVTGAGTIVSGGDTLVNSGPGTLVVGVGVKTRTTTAFGGGTLNFAAGNNTYIPLAGTFTSAGYTKGGLMVRQTSFAAAQNLSSAANSGVGPSAAFPAITPPADTAYNNRPPIGVTNTLTNSSITYSGLVEITAGGTYGFRIADDDQAALFIDGVMVLGDNIGGGGQGLTERPTAFIELTPGFHHIVFMGMNQGSGGGFNLLYSGPDTASNGSPNGFQVIDPNKLYYATNLGNAGNGFLNAAIISDAYNVVGGQTAVLDGQGTHFNLMFGSLSLNAASNLTVQNQFGTGYYGVQGATTITGAGAIVNPTTGTLYLAGGVNDGAALGLTKTGAGSLYLGTSTNFTGTFNMNAGFTLLAGTNALSSGTNVVASGAQLDLYGNSSHGNVTLNGSGVALLASGTTAALWNSLANSTGTLTGNVTIGAGSTRIGGIGDIVLSGALSDGAALGFTKVGGNTLTLSGNNVGFTGVATVSNGILKLGSNTALGTGGTSASNTVISSASAGNGAVLDLNGTNIANEFLSVAGTGFNNRGTSPNTLAAIINSSNTMATFGGPIILTSNTSIGSSRLNANSGVATAGDITLSGAITASFTPATGTFALTKVGNNTLHITGAGSTYSGMAINGGRVVISGAGHLGTGTSTNHSIAGYGQPTGLLPATTLQLDNTGTASNSRLGGRGLSMRNGHLIIDGHASTAVNESTGTNNLTISLGHSVITLNNNGGTLTLSVNQLIRDGSATLVIRGSDNDIGTSSTRVMITSGTANAIIPVGTENTTAQFTELDTSGILPWVLIDNGIQESGFGPRSLSFARYDTTLGLTNLESYAIELPTTGTANGVADVNLAVAIDMTLENTLSINDINLQTTGVNSITFNDTPGGSTITLEDLQILTIDSGGILALSSGNFVGNGSLNVAGNRQFVIHTIGADTVLDADVELGGRLAPTQGGLAKTGEGTLILGERNNYTGSTVVNLGTLKLNGGDNTLYYQFTIAPVSSTPNSTPQGQVLAVAPGGILDLNGTAQSINLLQGNGGQNVAGAGGIITNTSATAATLRLVVNGAVNWQGSINGNTNVIKSGGSTTIFYDNNAFTGNMLVQGGVLSLQDQGRLSGASSITVSRGVLRWDDTGMQQMTNRLGTAAPITLNGGALDFRGRGGTNSVMDIGSIHLAGGASYISAAPNTGTVTVRMDGLTRANTSTVTFAASSGTPGANPFFYFDSAPTLTNGILGGWAYALGLDGLTAATNIEFATYDAASGVRQLSGAQMVNHFNDPLANVRFGGNATVKAGGAIINSLTLNGAGITLSFAAANDVLNITSGGLLGGLDNNGRTIGSIATPGILTAGGTNPASDVYLYVTNPSNNMLINSIIADNPTNGRKLHLVLGSAGRVDNAARITLANANTYTGITYVQGARVDLANLTGSGNAITGDLIISGGVENLSDSANPDTQRVFNRANEQIANTANVTLLGNGAWDVGGYTETINNITFQSEGGSRNNAGPRILTGEGTLVVNGNITATNLLNASAVPLISGHLNFGSDNALTVTVDEVAGASNGIHNQIGLALNINVVGGGTLLTKQGQGLLSLGGHSDSAFQVNVAAGELTLNSTASYRNATINLASGTKLDMRGLTNVVVGNVTGTGTIFNFHVGAVGNLITGGANTDATFDGLFSSEFTSGMINVTKVGTGTWTLTADNTQQLAGTLLLLDGGILLNGTTARLGFAQQNIATGGVLTLDNSTNALNFRLGGPVAESSVGILQSFLRLGTDNINYTITTGDPSPNRNMEFRGGTVNLIGGSTNVMEVLSQIAMTSGAGVLNMTASSAETVVIVHNLAGVNNGILYLNAVGSGAILGGTKGAGHVNFAATTSNILGGGGAAGATNMSIRPDIIGTDSTGTGFVTHDLDGLRLLTAAEYKTPDARYLGTATPVRVTTVAGAGSFNNIGSGDNVRTTLKHSMDNSTTLNSLTLQSGGGVDSSAGGMLLGSAQGQSLSGRMFNGGGTLNTLTISSGGLLAFAGNTGIQGGAISVAADRRLYITALGDLSIDSYIFGAGTNAAAQGVVKSGAGTLTLGKKVLSIGAFSVQEGRVVLNGGDNTVMVAPTAGAATQLDLNMNGGILDLNGNDQAFGRITTTSGDTAPNGAGDITNTGALATLFTSTQAGGVTYSGNMSGALNVVKAGANTWALTGSHSYTGATIVRGGTLQLRDDAVLANTSSIEINYSTLLVDNTGWYGLNRLPTGVNVTLRGGNFQFTPRMTQATSTNVETIGVLTFAEGLSRTQFNATQGGSVTLHATSLARPNADATWFATPGIGVLGRGNADNNNLSPQIIFQTAPTLINNIIGGWAIHNGDNWLTYQSTVHSTGGTGVGVFSDTGAGFATYDEDTGSTAAFTAADSIATRNMRIQNGTYTVADIGGVGTAGNFLLNSLAFLTNGNNQNLVFEDNLDTLYLTAGAFLRSGNVSNSIGSAVNNGRITAGVVGATGLQHLYMHNNQNVTTINSRIVDNSASAPVRLVLWSSNGGRFDLSSVHLHTGGTVVQGNTNTSTVQLNIANAIPAGGLTINDTNVITNTGASVINGVNAANVVTINGGGVLNLTTNAAATNTLAGVVFNATGSSTTPQVLVGLNGSTLILTATNALTATNENYANTPTIGVTTAGNLQFSATAPVITVNNPSGIATHGLLINAVIQTNAGWTQALTKDGNGMLSLAAANTFTQGIVLKNGGLVLGTDTSLGTGKLTIGDGAIGGTHTLMTNGAGARTIANQIDINEDLIIGGTNGSAGTGHNLTASGAVALGGGDRVITVESPTVTFNITGVVSSTGGGLIKDGDGILQLSGANTYTGNTRVKRGLLRQSGGVRIPGTHLTVESAGTVDMNGAGLTVKSLSGEDSSHGGVITNSANNAQTLTIGDVLASVDTTFAGIITDNRSNPSAGSSRIDVIKNGDSRQKLTGVNTYGGTTTVNSTTATLGGGGHLQVGENGIGQTGAGATTVNAGATLSGSGLVNGTPGSTNHAVASGARLSPGDNYGDSNGTLTFSGNLTLNGGSQSLFQLTSRTTVTNGIGTGFVNVATSLSAELTTLNNAALPAGAHDALQINGTLNATGGNVGTSLFLVQDNSYVLNSSVGDVFDLLDWTGAFNLTTFNAGTNFRTGGSGGGDLFLPTLVNSGQFWDVSAFASHGILVVVPEPSRAMLLFGGLLLLLSFRRRRTW